MNTLMTLMLGSVLGAFALGLVIIYARYRAFKKYQARLRIALIEEAMTLIISLRWDIEAACELGFKDQLLADPEIVEKVSTTLLRYEERRLSQHPGVDPRLGMETELSVAMLREFLWS